MVDLKQGCSGTNCVRLKTFCASLAQARSPAYGRRELNKDAKALLPETEPSQSTRRPEIQGLRALAILAVIIYHSSNAWLPGGFIGVDLFFVISGALIVRTLIDEILATHRIDILGFWGRRAKRLIPNAALVLIFVLLSSALLLPSYRYRTIYPDVISAAGFWSNYHFANNAFDYFRANDLPSPVLHFWSLSIEEQFYIALPIVLSAATPLLRWSRRRLTLTLALICVSSFAFGLYAIEKHGSPFAFFHTETRIWQLVLGGLIGVHFSHFGKVSERLRSAIGYAGALAFLLCCFLLNDDVSYPGIWSILPTTAAALILIGSASPSYLKSFLSNKRMVEIGDRSYSLYLWHWPLLAIATECWPDSWVAKTTAIAAFTILAVVAYKFVEEPIHRSESMPLPALRLITAVATLALIISLGNLIDVTLRISPSGARTTSIAAAQNDFGQNYTDHCHLDFDSTTQPPCVYGESGASQTVVLFGDSHAAQWFAPLVKAATQAKWKVLVRTKTSCPSADASMWYPPGKIPYAACSKWRAAVTEEISQLRPDLIILANYSHYYGWLRDPNTGEVLDRPAARKEWVRATDVMMTTLLKTGSHLLLIRDNPKMLPSYVDCLQSYGLCGRNRHDALNGMPVDEKMLTSHQHEISTLDFSNQVCDENFCSAENSGSIIYQDTHHLTATFTASMVRLRRGPSCVTVGNSRSV